MWGSSSTQVVRTWSVSRRHLMMWSDSIETDWLATCHGFSTMLQQPKSNNVKKSWRMVLELLLPWLGCLKDIIWNMASPNIFTLRKAIRTNLSDHSNFSDSQKKIYKNTFFAYIFGNPYEMTYRTTQLDAELFEDVGYNKFFKTNFVTSWQSQGSALPQIIQRCILFHGLILKSRSRF